MVNYSGYVIEDGNAYYMEYCSYSETMLLIEKNTFPEYIHNDSCDEHSHYDNDFPDFRGIYLYHPSVQSYIDRISEKCRSDENGVRRHYYIHSPIEDVRRGGLIRKYVDNGFIKFDGYNYNKTERKYEYTPLVERIIGNVICWNNVDVEFLDRHNLGKISRKFNTGEKYPDISDSNGESDSDSESDETIESCHTDPEEEIYRIMDENRDSDHDLLNDLREGDCGSGFISAMMADATPVIAEQFKDVKIDVEFVKIPENFKLDTDINLFEKTYRKTYQ